MLVHTAGTGASAGALAVSESDMDLGGAAAAAASLVSGVRVLSSKVPIDPKVMSERET